jgi:predicted DNA-binding transcriptional regulator YafY
VLDEAAQVPDDFNLAEAWERQRAAFEDGARPWTVTVAVHPDTVDFFCAHARFQLAPRSTITQLGTDDGWPVLEMSFRAAKAAVAIVLAHGGEARLLTPALLRAELVDRAVAALHSHRSAS